MTKSFHEFAYPLSIIQDYSGIFQEVPRKEPEASSFDMDVLDLAVTSSR